MIQSDLSISQSSTIRVSRSSEPAAPESRHTDVKRESTTQARNQNPDGWVKIDRSKFSLSNRQASTSSLNSVARSIRFADQTMEKIGSRIDDMKRDLKTHVKNYPPYPPGSEERVRVLKSFSAFRKIIDELTMPPADSSASRIMTQSDLLAAEQHGIVVEHEGFSKTIRSQPVGTRKEGLDIPEFPETATDEDFEFMQKKLDNASQTLNVRRRDLQADAAGIFNPPGF